MIPVLEPAAMRAADAAACAQLGEITLMRAAGTALAGCIERLAPHGRIVAFAGPGNNGGDAYAAFAQLPARYERIILVCASGPPSPARVDARERALAAGAIERPLPTGDAEARDALAGAALALDALFGVGARLPLPESFHAALRALDRARLPVLAVDLPSGIDAASGALGEPAVRASATLTFGALKVGLLLDPAREHVGELLFAPIGFPPEAFATLPQPFGALDAAAFLAQLPARAATAEKRSAGAPLLLVGSAQFPGAAVLCARAAARAGAGYVTVAVPASVAPILRAHLVEQVVVALDESAAAERIVAELLDLAPRHGSLAIGPGLGLDARSGEVVRALLARTSLPAVVDASGLFHLAKHLAQLRGKPLLLTPHEGEFARLSGGGRLSAGTRVTRLRAFVERTGITTLLKGRTTLIDDGMQAAMNYSGTSALATAGSGDVLTGIVATLLAQGCTPMEAGRLAAFWHGLAGQVCAQERAVGTLAGDLPDALGAALELARMEARGCDGVFTLAPGDA